MFWPLRPYRGGLQRAAVLQDESAFATMSLLDIAWVQVKIRATWSEPEDILSNMVNAGHCQQPSISHPMCGNDFFNGLGYGKFLTLTILCGLSVVACLYHSPIPVGVLIHRLLRPLEMADVWGSGTQARGDLTRWFPLLPACTAKWLTQRITIEKTIRQAPPSSPPGDLPVGTPVLL